MKNPRISIVVCTFNGADKIRLLLDSLKKQTYKNLEIIIVDDGSTDRTSDIVKKYPFKLIKHKTNRGLADSRNTGVKNSGGNIIVFTDDDCIADKNWIKEIVKCYQQNPEINAVGGRVEPYSIDTLLEKYAYYAKHPIYIHPTEIGSKRRVKSYLSNMFGTKQKTLKNGQKLSGLMGLNSSYNKELIMKAGMHQPGIRRGVDWDLNMKLRKVGLNAIYCDKAVIYHKHRIGLKAFLKHMFSYGKVYWQTHKLHPKEVRFVPRPLPLLFILFFPLGYLLNMWYLPLVIILIYYLKDLVYTLFKLKSLSLFVTMPIIDFLRELAYFMGSIRGIFR